MTRARSLLGLASIILAAGPAGLGCGPRTGDDAPGGAPAVTSDAIEGCEPGDGAPDDLRCTGLYADVAAKTLSPRARAFAPAVILWSDGAEKSRWVDLPDGAAIDTTSMDEWRYPVGTKVWKEFKVNGRRVETRFMQKVRADRWVQAAYVWSADEARASRSEGAQLDLGGGATYLVPKSSECNDCHKGKKDKLLGFEAISLAQPGASGLTLGALAAEGRLSAPPAQTTIPVPNDATGRSAAALAWLHVNCGTSCHTGTSTATAYGTGLRLRIGWDELSGKPPGEWEAVRSTVGVAIKSPKWAGETRITAGDPGRSTLLRLLGQRGDEQMPPIGTRVIDEAGKRAVEAWITALPSPAPPVVVAEPPAPAADPPPAEPPPDAGP
ncbi:MAG TPA: hypothetical protein VLT33_43090 [Labilithrix sp.]|nr:hypothetical protein [Labilithrix sp.]